eukprot:12899001-Ditylum_brightwellii.AAC.1
MSPVMRVMRISTCNSINLPVELAFCRYKARMEQVVLYSSPTKNIKRYRQPWYDKYRDYSDA